MVRRRPHGVNMESASDKPATAPGAAEAPTGIRHQVLAVMSVLAIITYVDRVCISRMQNDIQRDLGLSNWEMAWVFNAFTLAYSLFEIPAGWWGDTTGPRRVLTRIVLCWSVFTALTGLVFELPLGGGLVLPAFVALVAVRFCFGAGEAGAFPNITRALASWYPFSARGFCQGIMWASGRFGGALSPVLFGIVSGVLALTLPNIPGLADAPHWRVTFVLFSLMGVAWCLFFWPWYRDRPADKAGVNKAELELIEAGRSVQHADSHSGVPWTTMLSSANLWLLCLVYFLTSFAWYVYITFLPKYLNGAFDISGRNTAMVPLAFGWEIAAFDLMLAMPLGFGALGCLLGGPLTDGLVRMTGSHRWGRSLPGLVGSILAGAALVAAMAFENPWAAMTAIAMSSLCKDLSMASTWSTCVDIGGRYSGTVSGMMNMTGNFGGVACPLFISLMLPDTGAGGAETWATVFYLFAAVHVLTGVIWAWVDARKPIFPQFDGPAGFHVVGHDAPPTPSPAPGA